MDTHLIKEPSAPKHEHARPLAILKNNLVIMGKQFYDEFELMQDRIRASDLHLADYELTLSTVNNSTSVISRLDNRNINLDTDIGGNLTQTGSLDSIHQRHLEILHTALGNELTALLEQTQPGDQNRLYYQTLTSALQAINELYIHSGNQALVEIAQRNMAEHDQLKLEYLQKIVGIQLERTKIGPIQEDISRVIKPERISSPPSQSMNEITIRLMRAEGVSIVDLAHGNTKIFDHVLGEHTDPLDDTDMRFQIGTFVKNYVVPGSSDSDFPQRLDMALLSFSEGTTILQLYAHIAENITNIAGLSPENVRQCIDLYRQYMLSGNPEIGKSLQSPSIHASKGDIVPAAVLDQMVLLLKSNPVRAFGLSDGLIRLTSTNPSSHEYDKLMLYLNKIAFSGKNTDYRRIIR